jgi:predicted RND superfamily exporter protein
MSSSERDFDSFVDPSYRRVKVAVLLKTDSNEEVKRVVAQLRSAAKELFPSGMTVSYGGDVVAEIALTETMVQGKILNIAQIMLVVFLISTVVFRSLWAGAIVLIPLLLSIVVVFGVMGWFAIPLNIPNSLIVAMSVGIGADYAIYLLYRLRECVTQGQTLEAALRYTLATAGKASMFVAAAVGGGYSVLLASPGFLVHQWLAIFIVLAMVVSVVGALVIVPTVVLTLNPDFVRQTSGGRLTPIWWGFIALGIASMALISRAVQASI